MGIAIVMLGNIRIAVWVLSTVMAGAAPAWAADPVAADPEADSVTAEPTADAAGTDPGVAGEAVANIEADGSQDQRATDAPSQANDISAAVRSEAPDTDSGAVSLSGLYGLKDDDPLVFLEQQIFRGEAPTAAAQLEHQVKQIEALHHRYHHDLVVPLTLLGDAEMVQQAPEKALEHYARARHIARVSFGLFDKRQIPVVYREADAHKRIGDLKAAGNREEYAYEVSRKFYEEYDAELLPALYRLAGFYLDTYNYLAARSLYSRALLVLEQNAAEATEAAIPALQGVARTHRLERFPPIYVANSDDNRLDGPAPGLTTRDLESQHITFNNFPAGERALQSIVEIRRSAEPRDPVRELEAILELADWHLLFGRTHAANTLYVHVYEQMRAEGHDPAVFFRDPVLIYFPRPDNPRPPPIRERGQAAEGMVALEFGVGTTGRVRGLKTVESDPEDLMDFRVRRSMRQAVFRPRLDAGTPVVAEAQTYTYRFPYFPSRAEPVTAESPAADENDTTSSSPAGQVAAKTGQDA